MRYVGSEEPKISVRAFWTQRPSVPKPALDLCDRLLSLDRLQDLYRCTRGSGSGTILRRLLDELQVECEVTTADLAHVPVTGAVMVLANHPHGLLDGVMLGATLLRVRPDVKILTNRLLAPLHELEEHCIFIDPFGGPEAARRNHRSLRRAIEWLAAGKLLAMFPAGAVSHWQFDSRSVTDPEWSETAARLIRRTRAATVPVFITGENSAAFQILGLLHERLRTAALPAELLNKQGKHPGIRIGKAVCPRVLERLATSRDATQYLRWRTYLLGEREAIQLKPDHGKGGFTSKLTFHIGRARPLATGIPRAVLASEVEALQPEQCMGGRDHYKVFLASARQIPVCLREIGCLRESAFRSVGEGTGRPLDLDRFDQWYDHLFAWNEEKQEIVGAYRLCRADQAIRKGGCGALYTHTLFRYGPELIQHFGPCLELGRSFVRREYQRQFTPLLLLWQGIGRYIALHPEIAVLFGAVSISSEYRLLSRRLIADFFLKQPCEELAGMVRARRPLRSNRPDREVYRSMVRCFRIWMTWRP